MRRRSLTLVLLILLVSACTPVPTPEALTLPPSTAAGTLTVFAADSLSAALLEMGNKFSSANPGVLIVYNFADAQQLAQQLSQGAQADIFAAANGEQLDAVVKAGRIAADAQQVFARKRLVIIAPAANPAQINMPVDLAKPGVKLALVAQEAPTGQAALDFLAKAAADPAFGAAYKEGVLANVISYEENAKAVLSKVSTGEVDAGIVYSSDVTGRNTQDVQQIDIPGALNMLTDYSVAPLLDTTQPELAVLFMVYVLGPEGQTVLEKHGFSKVE